jgi:hypothetical protein
VVLLRNEKYALDSLKQKICIYWNGGLTHLSRFTQIWRVILRSALAWKGEW